MMEKIMEILNACGADAWEIVDKKTLGWEFYFIGHRLDQNRAKQVEHITLKVYKYSDDGKSLGIASAGIAPTESEESIRKTAADLVYQASLVKNRPYELNGPSAAEPLPAEESTPAEEAEKFLTVFGEIAETEDAYLNSYEIFTERHERRLVTSRGIDITQRYQTSVLDIVVNAKNDEREIELYRLYDLGCCDSAQVKRDIEDLLRFGKDRLITVPTPNLRKAAIVLSTDAALSVYAYFLDNLDAAYQVRGVSSFRIGEPITEERSGDSVTIRALRYLPGSPCNFAWDAEGAPIRDCILMEEGVPRRFVGNRMFSQYLGLEDSFLLSNWSVSGGSRSAEDLRKGAFLEIVEFSDFQVDSMTGDIFGEIRLAYYHDGSGKVTPVSGGSVSGSMLENLGHMYLSKETRRFAGAEIPCVTRLENIRIAGAEQVAE